MKSTGRTSISSGDYISFLLNFQGVTLLVVGILLLSVLIAFDINSFIIMSALVRKNKIKMKLSHFMFTSIKSLKTFLKPSGVLVMLYISIIISLVGIGLTISPMKNFEIPNFIMDVVYKNDLYKIVYFFLISIFTYITIKYIFFFHFVLLEKKI